MRRLKNMTFYKRLQLSLLLLVLLPVAGSAIFTYYYIQHNVNQSMEERNKAYLLLLSQQIGKTIDIMELLTRYLVQDMSTLSRMDKLKDIASIRTYDQFESAEELKTSFRYLTDKSVYNQVYFLIVNRKGLIIHDQMPTETYEQLVKDLPVAQSRVNMTNYTAFQYLGGVFDSPLQLNTSRYLYFCRVIQDPWNGEKLGIIYLSLSQSYFNQLFSQQSSGILALYDVNGQYMAGNFTIPYLRESTKSSEQRSESEIPGYGWKLIYETPKTQIAGEMNRAYVLAGSVVALFLFIFGLFSVVLARRLHRPIRKLGLTAKKIGEGSLDIRFTDQGSDEFSRLGGILNGMLEQIRELIANNRLEQEQNRMLELQALASQIRPHFLLNTLNSFKLSLAVGKDDFHSGKMQSLIRMLRSYLYMSENTTLQQECKLLADYVEIMKMRNQMLLEIELLLTEEAKLFEMPKLLLQPLIENAIVHGFSDRRGQARIVVRGELNDYGLLIQIQDNGIGMPKDKMNTLNGLLSGQEPISPQQYDRVGMYNIIQRLKLIYGGATSMEIMANKEAGLTVILRIPTPLRQGGTMDVPRDDN